MMRNGPWDLVTSHAGDVMTLAVALSQISCRALPRESAREVVIASARMVCVKPPMQAVSSLRYGSDGQSEANPHSIASYALSTST